MADSMVSWRSAFWGVMAFAINAAVQDAGSILGMDRRYRIHLKFSPAVCLFDSIDIIVQILTHVKEYGLQGAVRQVAFDRQERTAAEPEAQSGPSKAIHWITFFGMISQCLKLFSCRGLPCTQTLAAVYLFAYVVQGTLNQYGNTGSCSTTDLSSKTQLAKLRRSSRVLCVALATATQTLLCIWAFVLPIPFDDSEASFTSDVHQHIVATLSASKLHLSVLVMLAVAVLIHLFAIVAVYSGYWHHPPRALKLPVPVNDTFIGALAHIGTLCLACAPALLFNMYVRCLVVMGSLLNYEQRLAFKADMQRNGMQVNVARKVAAVYQAQQVAVLCIVVAGAAATLFRTLPGRRWARVDTFVDPAVLSTALTVMNLLCGLFASAVVYDPRNTWKPAWTENLG